MAQYTAKQIAKWFIQRAKADVPDNGGEYLTPLKLQKLLYYAQGSFLAIKNKPLFDEKIVAWSHGPVVRSVYDEYKGYAGNPITEDISVPEVDQETENLLNEVYQVFGQYSAWKLRELTHSETPWKETAPNGVIKQESIKRYFKEHYIEE